ncbi:tRNA (guanine-N(7)-)-methyltransferase [Hasllibacter halocynthiae]|uniref:tRNA (guanine-N(7)-)-methyltransferase n=1 Tax=Hasllibacter halocynthiae TaxID=595589 RepID=A0A2T0X147_9RHOB|nr:tRNA (guanine(46)-N(7))-methyltransferase TrmB [Hasllibacter halocynthiae]PRY92647.1 tRNA (guanine-N(7)-)-methyltransferase [Hasllibacter halocynthiae]
MERPRRNFYGRRRGQHLKSGARRRLEEDLGRLAVPGIGWEENPGRAPLDLDALLGGRPLWLEVGFGGGEHLAALARANPGIGFIGAEPYADGVAKLLALAEGLENVRIHPGDARDLMDVLPEGSARRAYLLYPDPWPKTRHHRRRFVTPEHLEPLRRAMATGAELRVATDIGDYVRQTLEEVPRAGFRWLAERAEDWREPWEGWHRTRYEAKALREGRTPHYLRFAAV